MRKQKDQGSESIIQVIFRHTEDIQKKTKNMSTKKYSFFIFAKKGENCIISFHQKLSSAEDSQRNSSTNIFPCVQHSLKAVDLLNYRTRGAETTVFDISPRSN